MDWFQEFCCCQVERVQFKSLMSQSSDEPAKFLDLCSEVHKDSHFHWGISSDFNVSFSATDFLTPPSSYLPELKYHSSREISLPYFCPPASPPLRLGRQSLSLLAASRPHNITSSALLKPLP
jgi:hypothetical protein